jgi:hypothetical protein
MSAVEVMDECVGRLGKVAVRVRHGEGVASYTGPE